MGDFSLYGMCEICKKKKFFVSKRMIKIPVAGMAKSKKKLCTVCHLALKSMIR